MSLTITESAASRGFEVGPQASRTLEYDIIGSDPTSSTEEDDVRALIYATAPSVYWGLILRTINAESRGGGVWKGYAKYQLPSTEYTFEVGSGSYRITQSYSTVSSYAPAGLVAPNFAGAIGVSDDRVEGVEVPLPQLFQFTETQQFDNSVITTSYKIGLATLALQSFNNATFKGYDAGTVAFLGCTGSKRPDDYWTLTFRFGYLPNVSGLSIGGITGITKYGQDYLWFRYAEFADNTAYALVKRPIAAYVERILTPADYSTIGIGV